MLARSFTIIRVTFLIAILTALTSSTSLQAAPSGNAANSPGAAPAPSPTVEAAKPTATVGPTVVASPTADSGLVAAGLAAHASPTPSATATPLPSGLILMRSGEFRREIDPRRREEMLDELHKTGIYVSPEMQSLVTAQQIRDALPRSRTRVNVVVADAIPVSYKSVGQWALYLHGYLHAGDGITIVIASTSVGFHANDVDKKSEQNLILGASRTFDAEGYAKGIAQIVRNIEFLRGARERARIKLGIASLAGLAILGVCIYSWWRQFSRSHLEHERTEVRNEAAQLLISVKQVDAQLALAVVDDTDEARIANLNEHRHKLREILRLVKQRLDTATTIEDTEAARAGLGEAEAEMLRASASLQHPEIIPGAEQPGDEQAVEVSEETQVKNEEATTGEIAAGETSAATEETVPEADPTEPSEEGPVDASIEAPDMPEEAQDAVEEITHAPATEVEQAESESIETKATEVEESDVLAEEPVSETEAEPTSEIVPEPEHESPSA